MRNGILIGVLALSSLAATPAFIPDTTPAMQSAPFWVEKHPAPDQVILNAEQVQALNQKLAGQGLTMDLFDSADRNYHLVRETILRQIHKFKHGEFYDRQGQRAQASFFEDIEANIAVERFWDSLQIRYAIVTHTADQRLLPTDEILTEIPLDLEFDEVQNSSLDIGTVLRVLLASQDGKWYYAESTASSGWVKAQDIAFGQGDVFQLFYQPDVFVVVASAKADVYADRALSQAAGRVRMGAVFALRKEETSVYEISFPSRLADGSLQVVSGYLPRADASRGFLDYTPRVIMEQAFKMLNAPYGWGGLKGEQDCSSFLKQIFATVGILLPRNSGEQGQVGRQLKDAQLSFKGLENALPGITLAQMKGHIVLFLGMHDGKPYAIHEIHAYRVAGNGKDEKRVLNRAVVSSFDLGKGSQRGSLLERIVSVREVR